MESAAIASLIETLISPPVLSLQKNKALSYWNLTPATSKSEFYLLINKKTERTDLFTEAPGNLMTKYRS